LKLALPWFTAVDWVIQLGLDPEQIGAADSIGKSMSNGCLGGGPSKSVNDAPQKKAAGHHDIHKA
jgi:hypothetical protein